MSSYVQKLLDGVFQAIKLLILERLNRGERAARIWGNRKHMNVQHSVGCLWYKIVYVHVSRIVSVLALKTHIHRVWCRQLWQEKQRRKCLYSSRESWQAVELTVHFPISYQPLSFHSHITEEP